MKGWFLPRQESHLCCCQEAKLPIQNLRFLWKSIKTLHVRLKNKNTHPSRLLEMEALLA